MTAIRQAVYAAIDSERAYQDKLTDDSSRPDMIEDFHVGDALTAIRINLAKAEEAWYKGSVPHHASIEFLRKIAGICVKVGETYGMPSR